MHRRTRWIAGTVTALLLAAGGFIAVELAAPPGTAEHAARLILEDGRTALRVRNSGPVLRHMSPDANVIGLTLDRLEATLSTALNEVPNGLELVWKELQVTQSASRATVNMRIEVSEKLGKDESVYFQPDLELKMRILTVPGPFGIGTMRRWRITQVKATPGLPLPHLDF